MNIAYTMAPGRGDTDELLYGLAQRLQQGGLVVCGTVQINSENCDAGPCDMDVRVLPDGPVIRISQSLGREAKGCRLDPGALDQAAGLVEAALEDGADVLIVNKFGKHEADGRGFRGAIGDALARDIPVLVGLNPLNAAAFMDFTAGLASELQPNEAELLDWLREKIGSPSRAQRLARAPDFLGH